MKNTQISFDEELLQEIDRIADASNKTRTAVVREAVRYWLKEKEIKDFEAEWITALQNNPEDTEELNHWASHEEWENI